MTRLVNVAADFADEALAGFVAAKFAQRKGRAWWCYPGDVVTLG